MKQKILHPHHKLPGKRPATLSLLMLVAFGSLGAVLMTPALPEIAYYFDIPSHTAKLVVTFYLIGYALGQLIYGSIANHMGRKKAYFIGLSVATAGSVLSILSPLFESFGVLLCGRFIEALGMSCGLVLSQTVIGDFYHKKKAQATLSILYMGLPVVAGLAVMIGGLITQYFKWQMCFYFLLVYGIILYIPTLFLPETGTIHKLQKKGVNTPIKSLISAFKDSTLVLFSLVAGLGTACVYIFAAEGPIIGRTFLKMDPARYGLLNILPVMGMLLGSLFTALYVKKNAVTMRFVHFGFFLQIFVGALVLITLLNKEMSSYLLFIPTFFILLGTTLVGTKLRAFSVINAKDTATAASLVGFMSLAIPCVATFILSIISYASPILLPLFFLSLSTLACLFYLAVRFKKGVRF